MIDRLLSIVSPHSCYGCGEIGQALCDSCMYDIASEPFTYCGLCLSPVAQAGHLCASCQPGELYDGLWCVDYRRGVIKELVDAYKFDALKAATRPLARLIDDALPLLTDVTVVAVPTDMRHVRQLGYDHAYLIAKELADLRGLPIARLLERRHKSVQHQSSRYDRERQARELLGVAESIGGDFLVVDDILTTGATMRAAAACLKQSGAKRVYGAIIARQPLD